MVGFKHSRIVMRPVSGAFYSEKLFSHFVLNFNVLFYFKVNMYLMNASLYHTKSSMHRVQMFRYVCTF